MRKKDLTHGRIAGQILVFSLPLIASNVLQVLFNMADVAVIGRFAGSRSLGSVGSTSILITLFVGFLIGMGCGVNALAARYIGANSQRDTDETVHTSFIVCLAVGIIILLAGLFGARWLLRLLNTKDELLDGAVLYIRIFFLGMPGMAVFNFGSAVYSAMGDTRRPLYYLTIAGVVNVALNLFFVIVCKMDVAGVGTASAVSQFLSAVLIVGSLMKNGTLQWRKLRVIPEKAKFLLNLGLPSGFQCAIFAIANLFVQAGVNSFDAVMVEGCAAATNADGLVYDIMAAFYTACASFMGQNYGAGNVSRVKKSYILCVLYSWGIGVLAGTLLAVFGRQFLSLFTLDKEVVDAGMHRLVIMGLSYGWSAFMDCTIAAARGLGKTLWPTVIVISGSCVFRVAWIYTVFAHFGTADSLFLLYIFSWVITGIAEVAYFVRVYKQRIGELRGGTV